MRRRIWLSLGALVLLGCPFPDAPRVQGIGGGVSGGGAGGDRLAFLVQPTNAFTGIVISPTIQVAAIDTSSGLVDTSFTGLVSVALSNNPTGATLGGATSISALSGIAFFSDLTVSQAGSGYTLIATSGSLASVTSGSFTITDAP